MTKLTLLLLLITISAAAQVSVPEGTPVRLRMEQDLPKEGTIEFSVTEEVRVQGKTVIAVGARAIGKLMRGPDVAVERVFAADGSWLDLRTDARIPGVRAIRAAGLSRVDSEQTGSAFARGATYLLYVDRTSVVHIAAPPTEREDGGILMLGWLNSKLTPESAWLQRYSNWLCVSGILLLIIGVLYQFSEEQRS